MSSVPCSRSSRSSARRFITIGSRHPTTKVVGWLAPSTESAANWFAMVRKDRRTAQSATSIWAQPPSLGRQGASPRSRRLQLRRLHLAGVEKNTEDIAFEGVRFLRKLITEN